MAGHKFITPPLVKHLSKIEQNRLNYLKKQKRNNRIRLFIALISFVFLFWFSLLMLATH